MNIRSVLATGLFLTGWGRGYFPYQPPWLAWPLYWASAGRTQVEDFWSIFPIVGSPRAIQLTPHSVFLISHFFFFSLLFFFLFFSVMESPLIPGTTQWPFFLLLDITFLPPVLDWAGRGWGKRKAIWGVLGGLLGGISPGRGGLPWLGSGPQLWNSEIQLAQVTWKWSASHGWGQWQAPRMPFPRLYVYSKANIQNIFKELSTLSNKKKATQTNLSSQTW